MSKFSHFKVVAEKFDQWWCLKAHFLQVIQSQRKISVPESFLCDCTLKKLWHRCFPQLYDKIPVNGSSACEIQISAARFLKI